MKTIILLVLFIVSSATAFSLLKIELSDGTDLIGIKTGEDSNFVYFEELNLIKHSFPLNNIENITELNLVEITMKSSIVAVGYVGEITDKKLILSYPGYGESELFRSNIEFVKPYQENEEDIRLKNMPEEEVVAELQPQNSSYSFSYPVIGATIGLPGVFNILLGYYSHSFMINGTYGHRGVSISPGFILSHLEHRSYSLCLDLSYIDINDIKSLI